MASVGLVVNPNAAHDVRRLTSLARTMTLHERVNVTARILAGLAATCIDTVWYMPDEAHIVEQAAALVASESPPSAGSGWIQDPPVLRAILRAPAADAAGTARAAAAMAEAGAACVIVHGGDGTHRAVVMGWPEAVILPLAGGTNNAFAVSVDPTAAGLAAGLFAADPGRYAGHLRPAVHLEVRIDHADGPDRSALALVDVAVLAGHWVGARAIWDPGLLLEAVVSRSDPALSGLAGVAGTLRPLGNGSDPTAGVSTGPPRGVRIAFGRGGSTVLAPLSPGRLIPVEVRVVELVGPDKPIWLGPGPGRVTPGWRTVALDGEREFVLAPNEGAEVRLVDGGLLVLDAPGLLRAAAAAGILGQARTGGKGGDPGTHHPLTPT